MAEQLHTAVTNFLSSMAIHGMAVPSIQKKNKKNTKKKKMFLANQNRVTSQCICGCSIRLDPTGFHFSRSFLHSCVRTKMYTPRDCSGFFYPPNCSPATISTV